MLEGGIRCRPNNIGKRKEMQVREISETREAEP